MFKVSADDGLRRHQVLLTKEELAEMMSEAIWEGVVASNEIEGISSEGIEKPKDIKLPDSLFTTE